MVEAKHISIRYLSGDFNDIGLKEWTIQKLKGERRVKSFWAVDDVSFQIDSGDFLGIVGVNGSGKSTLLKAVTGILPPQQGDIITEGNVVALLELGTGFDGDLNLRENIRMRGALLGYTKAFIEERIDQILEFAELTDFQWYKYKQLSSGMKSRLAFSICCMVRPDVLILDEVLSVGDGSFRKKSEDKMMEVIQGGAATLFVSHSIAQMRRLCNKLLWLDHGKQIAFAESREETLQVLTKYEYYLRQRAANPNAVPDLNYEPPKPEVKKPSLKKPAESPEFAKYKRDSQNREATYRKYMEIFRDLILHPEKIGNLEAYMKHHKITHAALYGETMILKTIVPLLERAGVTVDYVVENRKSSSYSDTVYPRSLEEYPETQLIVIGDVRNTEIIKKKLEKLTTISFCSIQELFDFQPAAEAAE